MDTLALILVIIGALNWGMVGLFQFDLIASIFGGMSTVVSRIILSLIHIYRITAPKSALTTSFQSTLSGKASSLQISQRTKRPAANAKIEPKGFMSVDLHRFEGGQESLFRPHFILLLRRPALFGEAGTYTCAGQPPYHKLRSP